MTKGPLCRCCLAVIEDNDKSIPIIPKLCRRCRTAIHTSSSSGTTTGWSPAEQKKTVGTQSQTENAPAEQPNAMFAAGIFI
jgi:hypothetical protein